MMLPLLFHVFLLSRSMVASAQAPALTKPNCQPSCGNVTIPYPFGIGSADCYNNDWFAIDCISDRPFIRSINLEVLEITLPNNTVRVNLPVYNSCRDSIVNVNLEETTFFFSGYKNIFAGLGCNNVAHLHSMDSVVAGCVSTCSGENTTSDQRSCFGIECCETRIPPFLRMFNASIDSISGLEDRQQECRSAFLVEQQWFETNLKTPQDIQGATHVPVVLDWGIHNSSANILVINQSAIDYSNSSCEFFANSSSSSSQLLPVVQCNCYSSSDGNPYLLQGCQDIDECAANQADCAVGMICYNVVGGWGCTYPEKTKHNMVLLGIGTGLAGLFILIVGVWWLYIIIKKRRDAKLKKKYFKRNGGLLLQQELTSSGGSVDRSKLFSSKDLDKATDHFNQNRVLGQGGQGTVYKGMLTDGRIVAVKKTKAVDEGKLHEFINEVVILSQINHRNVVKLLGCCLETKVPLLVYEFIPNGTLFQYLHGQNEELAFTWSMRLQIVAEVAGALSYLHSAASTPIYHRDIKSTNILLDEKYKAKVADFGTAKSVAIDQTHVTTKVQGTFGYLDPEFFRSSQFTDKSDVYSFGVVLVEILTGQKPITSTDSEERISLVAYFIISMEENRLSDIVDAQVLNEGKKDEIMTIANLAKRCLNLNGKLRPTMKEVALELEGIRASQKICDIRRTHQDIQNELSYHQFESWDVVSTSTSTFDKISPSVDFHPLSSNTIS